MNYLVIEGYKDAAEKFQQEAGTDPGIDLKTITNRMAIRTAIQRGEIEEGIDKVNNLNPEILDTNPQLIFHLKQQQLIELIRKGLIDEALQFAQEELAHRGEENAAFFRRIGKNNGFIGIRKSISFSCR